jgi:hypothetical protein
MTEVKHGVLHKTKRSVLGAVDLSQIPTEEISSEESLELVKLSKETEKDGISWNKFKAELGL